jgi:predicted subunit of tRNA(5-methylaminomethyl-2-thiouridylate) methyltransferase
MLSGQIGGVFFIGDIDFIQVVVLQQFSDVLFVELVFDRLRQYKIEHEVIVELQFNHVVVDLTKNFVDFRVSDYFLTFYLFVRDGTWSPGIYQSFVKDLF